MQTAGLVSSKAPPQTPGYDRHESTPMETSLPSNRHHQLPSSNILRSAGLTSRQAGLCGQRHRRRPATLPITRARQCHAGPCLEELQAASAGLAPPPRRAAATGQHRSSAVSACRHSQRCKRLPGFGSFFSLKTYIHVLFAFICELLGRVETCLTL